MLCSSRLRLTTPWESARGCEPSRTPGSAGKKRSNRNPEDARGNVWRTRPRLATPWESARGRGPSRTPSEAGEKRVDSKLRERARQRLAHLAASCDPMGERERAWTLSHPRRSGRKTSRFEIPRTRAATYGALGRVLRPHGRAREGVNPLAPPGLGAIRNGRRRKLLRPKGIQGIIPCRRASCTWQDASRTHARLCRTASRPRPGTDGSGTRSGFRP